MLRVVVVFRLTRFRRQGLLAAKPKHGFFLCQQPPTIFFSGPGEGRRARGRRLAGRATPRARVVDEHAQSAPRAKNILFLALCETRGLCYRHAATMRARCRGSCPKGQTRCVRRPRRRVKKVVAMSRCTTLFAPKCANTATSFGNESGRARRPDRCRRDVRDGRRTGVSDLLPRAARRSRRARAGR